MTTPTFAQLFIYIGAAMLIPQVLLKKMGPFGIFDKFEKAVVNIQPLHCPICLTFWLSVFIVVMSYVWPACQIIWQPFGIAGWALYAGLGLQAVITRDPEKGEEE